MKANKIAKPVMSSALSLVLATGMMPGIALANDQLPQTQETQAAQTLAGDSLLQEDETASRLLDGEGAEAADEALAEDAEAEQEVITLEASAGKISRDAESDELSVLSATSKLFNDVQDSDAWFYTSVYQVVDLGLFKGYDGGDFGPNDTLTRAQAAVILWRYCAGGEGSGASNTTGMSDVADGAYYTAAANWAVENGIIKGKEDGNGGRSFDPDGTITAEELCVILANVTGGKAANGMDKVDSLADAAFVSSWAKAACEWALENGVLSGYENADGSRSLHPQESVFRARAAAILVNAINEGVLTPEVEDSHDSPDYQAPATHTHSYTAVVTAPTCTAKGYTTHTCSCGDYYVDSYTAATGHKYGSYVTTKAATCTATGTQTATCSCGAKQTKTIVALGHDFGSNNKTCSRCSTANPNYVAPLGSPVTINSGWYTITAGTSTNLRLDVRDGSVDLNAQAQTYTKNSTDAQRWYITRDGSTNYYYIMSGISGLYLQTNNNGKTNGTVVVQAAGAGTDAQRWCLYKVGNSYVFKNKASGRVLDIANASTASGTQVQIYDYNGTSAQMWTLASASAPSLSSASISNGWYYIYSRVGSGQRLDVSGNSSDNGGNVQVWGETTGECQKWYIKKVGSYYCIQSGSAYANNATRVLDCYNGGTANGTNLQIWDYYGNDAQLWSIKKLTDGSCVFVNKGSGKVLDISNASCNANAQTWTYNYTRAQSFTLTSTTAPVQYVAKPSTTPAAGGTATPASGAASQQMNKEELNLAYQIFNAYNDYRASKGLSRVGWSDDCANMAWGSATGCASIHNLKHRLGIPSAVQNNYSDILQYSTWKMTASEAVQRWSQSDGHRRMMQCDSATVAGVACYNDNGTWYYVIVYNFNGCNQSGS